MEGTRGRRPDYREIFEPRDTIPISDLPHRLLKKFFLEKSRKNPSKGHPRRCFLAEFKANFPGTFFSYNMQINVGIPWFRFMRQAQNTDTHALNQPGMSQNSSPP